MIACLAEKEVYLSTGLIGRLISVVDNGHPAFPLLPEVIIRDEAGHKMGDVDAAGDAGGEEGAAGGGGVEGVFGDLILINEAIRAHGDPLDGGMALSYLNAQVLCSTLVIALGRQEQAHEGDGELFSKGDLFMQISVAVADGVHEDVAYRLRFAVGDDSLAQAAGGVGDEEARLAVDALEGHIMAEAGGDGAAAGDETLELGVGEVEETGLDEFKIVVGANIRREMAG